MQTPHPQKPKATTIITISIVAFIILVIIIIFLAISNAKKSSTLHTIIAPSFATLTINDKNYQPNQDYKFEPGNYEVKISAAGFQEKTLTLELTHNQTTNLYQYLTPDDNDLSWYYQDPKENKLYEQVTDALASQQAAEYREKYPIVSLLPLSVVEVDKQTYTMKEYRIDVGEYNDCKTNFCLKITDMTGGNQEAAYAKLRDNGYNPEDYEIIYQYKPYFTGAPARP